MKADKVAPICYYIASVCFYITALINFFSNKDTSMGVIYLCLGSTMLCLATVWKNNNGDDKDTEVDEDVEESEKSGIKDSETKDSEIK